MDELMSFVLMIIFFVCWIKSIMIDAAGQKLKVSLDWPNYENEGKG